MAFELFEFLIKFILLFLLLALTYAAGLSYLMQFRYKKSIFGKMYMLIFISLLFLIFYFATEGDVLQFLGVGEQFAFIHKAIEIAAGLLWLLVAYNLLNYMRRLFE